MRTDWGVDWFTVTVTNHLFNYSFSVLKGDVMIMLLISTILDSSLKQLCQWLLRTGLDASSDGDLIISWQSPSTTWQVCLKSLPHGDPRSLLLTFCIVIVFSSFAAIHNKFFSSIWQAIVYLKVHDSREGFLLRASVYNFSHFSVNLTSRCLNIPVTFFY